MTGRSGKGQRRECGGVQAEREMLIFSTQPLWSENTINTYSLSRLGHPVETDRVSSGLSWLQNQVQLDGTLANEGTSIATALQNRAEVAQTFKTLSALPANLTDVIASETEDNTEYLARRIVSLTLAGRDASALVTVLSARQN